MQNVGFTPVSELPSYSDAELRSARGVRLDGVGVGAHGSADDVRAALRKYFHVTYVLYERLFEGVLRDDDVYQMRPQPLRHPLIFYWGHTAVLYINKMVTGGVIGERVNEQYERDLAVGVDEMSWDDVDNRAARQWPTAQQVRDYRLRVRQLVDYVICHMPLTLPINWESPWWPIVLGIEHERIHFETSTVLFRQLPIEYVKQEPLWDYCHEWSDDAPTNELIAVAGGAVELGEAHDTYRFYGWDNEYGKHAAQVKGFHASKYLASNAEFLEFVLDGGYEKRELWSEDGWAWRSYHKATMPEFWLRRTADAPAADRKSYVLRLMASVVPMPWDWPAEVCYYEARAFCNWKTARARAAGHAGVAFRLPTEDEWYVLRDSTGVPDVPAWPSDAKAPANLNAEHEASSCPVTRHKHGEFFDVVGNVWQWTETHFYGFDGFKPHPVYDDFSVPCFDGQHHMIKGGSWASTGGEAYRAARYAFRPHFYQHAGFRYVQVDEANLRVKQFVGYYDTDQGVHEYLEFHYGAEYYGVPLFAKVCAELCAAKARELGVPMRKALDIGCATGRTTFELCRHFDGVVGVDFSARFIRECFEMQRHGSRTFTITTEGDLGEEVTRARGVPDDLARRATFLQGDACNLHGHLRDFDVVIACNLIDRLYDPSRFLSEVANRMVPGGLLVLTSPYTWLRQFTAAENWIGGYTRDGVAVDTLSGLKAVLAGRFDMAAEPVDVPMVLRETRRKFQHSLPQMTFWRLRA